MTTLDNLRRDVVTSLSKIGIIIAPSGATNMDSSSGEDPMAHFAANRRRGFGNLAKGNTLSHNASFQFGSEKTRGPVTREVIESLVGGSEEFLAVYKSFEDNYFEELAKVTAPGVDADIQRASGTIDLSLLPKATQQTLKDQFDSNVAKFLPPSGGGGQSLASIVGLPSMAVRTSNDYTDMLFRYVVDQTGGAGLNARAYHPYQILLNSVNFTYSRTREGLNFGVKNLPTVATMKAAMADVGDGIAGNTDALQRSLVFDVETTGVTKFDVVRSISVSEMVLNDDGTHGMRVIHNYAFDTPEMAALRDLGVGSLKDRSLLGRLAADESAEIFDVGPGGSVFVDKMTEVLETMISAEYRSVSAHNASFDIKKILYSITQQEAYATNDRAQQAVRAFTDRLLNEEGYRRDTLHTARIYQLDQANQILENLMMDDAVPIDELNRRYIEALFGVENLTSGNKATFAGVEEIALHTNLFELIDAEPDGQEVLEKLYKGTHIAETDTILQGYIETYMKTGQLAIWPLTEVENSTFLARTDLGDTMRNIVARSSAVVSTTNVDDVFRLSEHLFNKMVTTTEANALSALSGVRVFDAEDRLNLGLGAGYIKVKDGQIYHTPQTATVGDDLALVGETMLDEGQKTRAIEFLQTTLRQARGPLTSTTANNARKSIHSLGVTYATNQGIEDVESAFNAHLLGINEIPTDSKLLSNSGGKLIPIEHLKQGLSAVYRNLGSLENAGMHTGTGVDVPPVVSGPIERYGITEIEDLAKSLARIGDVLPMTTPRDRFIGTVISGLTASSGSAAFSEAQAKGSVSMDDPLRLLRRRKLGTTQGLGYSFAKGYGLDKTRIFTAGDESLGRVPIMSKELFELIATGAGVDLTKPKVKKITFAKDFERDYANLAILFDSKVEGSFTGNDARRIAERIVGIFSDNNQVKNVLRTMGYSDSEISVGFAGGPASEMTERQFQVKKLAENASNFQHMLEHSSFLEGDRAAAAADMLTETIMKTGIVTEQFTGKGIVDEMEEALERLGINTANDIEMPRMIEVFDTASGRQARESVSGSINMVASVDEAVKRGRTNRFSISVNHAEGIMRVQALSLETEARKADEKFAHMQMLRDVSRDSGYSTKAVLADSYRRAKQAVGNLPGGPKGLLAAVGLTALGVVGYKKSRPGPYDETIDMQPYEGTNYTRADNDSLAYLGPMPSSRRDPLYTAGVVGNLDRNKINHTRMGNNKYDHLF